MSYKYITENLRTIPYRKLFYLFVLLNFNITLSQVVTTDSISVNKTWIDKNGKNLLNVNVNALCNPDKPPFDGHRTIIEANLKNKKYKLNLIFDDEDYQSEMILFNEKEIVLKDIQKTKAVFIPFFYCGNWDSVNKVSYIIFYNNKKYLYHIEYYCNEDYNCKLNDDLKTKLKRMPINLKKIFIKMLQTKYKKASDLHAN